MFKKLLTIGITLLLGIALTGCGSSDKLQLEKIYKVELGNKISTEAKAYLKDADKAVIKDTVISFNKNDSYTIDKKEKVLVPVTGTYLPVGKYQASAKYKEESKKFTVEVKDTTAPKFVDFKRELIIEVNAQDVDLAKYYKAEDLSAVAITFYDRDLDLTKPGSYEIKVIAADSQKNKNTKKVTVKVVSMEVAEKDGVTPTIEGTKPQSKALEEKVAKEEAEKAAQEQPTQPQQPATGAGTGGIVTTPPSNNQNTGGSSGTTTPPASNVCVPDGTYQGLGNSGRWFNSKAEADAWAWEELDPYKGFWGKQGYSGYHGWTVEDSCGDSRSDIWSVHFY